MVQNDRVPAADDVCCLQKIVNHYQHGEGIEPPKQYKKLCTVDAVCKQKKPFTNSVKTGFEPVLSATADTLPLSYQTKRMLYVNENY